MKLNVEQRRIVELEPSGHMLLKGVAGSGKTTVSIMRVPYLSSRYCHENDDRVLLLTFNKTLVNYIKYLYNKVESNEQLMLDFIGGSSENVLISTVDSIMYKYFNQYCSRANKQYRISEQQDQYRIIIQAINKVKDKFPQLKVLSPKYSNFLLDEISWIKACGIEYLTEYQNIDRIGRASGDTGTPQKLPKNSDTREAIYELMQAYEEFMESEGMIDFKKMNLIALHEAQINPKETYTHIIIDESQDLTKVQLDFIKCIYKEKKHSSILFVADNTQSIYSHSWLGKGRPYTTIGYDMSGRSRMLTKNYRTTTEISSAAFGLIEHDENIKNNVDFVKPSLIDRQGHPPIYRHFMNREQQYNFVLNEVKNLQNDYSLSDICIVSKEKRLIESCQSYLESRGIACEILTQSTPDFESDKIKMVTFHSIKGLEFKIIFLIDIDDGVIPNTLISDYDDEKNFESDERKLLYVGMTRANELLYISSVHKPSRFIKEISNDFLRMRKDTSIKPFLLLSLDQYKLVDHILDIKSKEEAVRQWLLKELNETYGYPLDLIKLEQPVQQFSKRGLVDLAINIYFKGKEVPFIFAEVKRLGVGINDALSQLISYMETNETVRYGIATDGMEIEIISRDGEKISDIPKCTKYFLPDMKDNRVYTNLRTGRRYGYSIDKTDPSSVVLKEEGVDLIVQFEEFIKVPMAGEVAAGLPITINREYGDYFTLPKEWIVSSENTFALKVTGDSMIEVGINRGDFVIVNKQNTAQNGDIVIALINDEATMKKLNTMGDSILLISENKNYEPILMKAEDVIINGKVIGIINT